MRKVLAVPMDHSLEELHAFVRLAWKENPSLAPVVEDYLRLARRAETRIDQPVRSSGGGVDQMHLFDLLRQKRFFPRNSDLAKFAARVAPEMRTYSFEKMARSDIAARV